MNANGQAAEDLGTTGETDPGTTEAAPVSAADDQITAAGPESISAEGSYYDPSTLPSELLPLQKQLQGAYTKKFEALANDRKSMQAKIEAYDAFMADPQGTLAQLQAQYGAVPQQQTVEGEWEPQNWTEVIARIKDETRQEVLQELQPVVGKVRDMQKTQIEGYLDGNYPDWRTYEKEMISVMEKHPTLATDPDRLYELAVPREVRDRRATQAALKKLESTTESASVSGPSATSKQPSAVPQVKNFADAVAAARIKLRSGGG